MTIDGQAHILYQKINGSLLDIKWEKDHSESELDFLQNDYYELAQSIVTLISLILSLASLPYCVRFCREKCLENNASKGRILQRQINEGQIMSAPPAPRREDPEIQGLREERSALLGNLTNQAIQTLAATSRNK